MSELMGSTYIIKQEPPQLCEYCGQMRETRPVGTNNSNICFECAHKPENIKESNAKLKKIIDRSKAVVIV